MHTITINGAARRVLMDLGARGGTQTGPDEWSIEIDGDVLAALSKLIAGNDDATWSDAILLATARHGGKIS